MRPPPAVAVEEPDDAGEFDDRRPPCRRGRRRRQASPRFQSNQQFRRLVRGAARKRPPLNVRGPRDSIWNVTGTPALISARLRFANLGEQLHVRQVRDSEQDRRRKRCCDRLSDFDVPADDDAVHRRTDGRARAIDFRLRARPACATRTSALAAFSAAAACLAASCAASSSACVIRAGGTTAALARCAFVVRSSSSTFRRCASAAAFIWPARASASAGVVGRRIDLRR